MMLTGQEFTLKHHEDNTLDLEKISTDADYCLQILKTLGINDLDFEKTLEQIEKRCSKPVVEKLLDFTKYLPFKLLNDDDKANALTTRMIALLTRNISQQKIPYEIVIKNLIIQHRRRVFSKISCGLIVKLLMEDIEFQKNFVNDDTYRPLFRHKFVDRLIETLTGKDISEQVLIKCAEMKTGTIDQELKDEAITQLYAFGENLSKEQKCIIGVANILSDKRVVFEQLEKLEKILAKRRETLISLDKHTAFNKNLPPDDHDHKLLSGCLYEWAKDNDFKGYAKVLRAIPPALMLNNFAGGLLFKDKGSRGKHHGEWTHFLQWYILTEANKDDAYLSVPPNQLLIWIGKHEDGAAIWDKTFEGNREPNTSSLFRPEFDARQFHNLNHFLLGNECSEKFPVIHEVIDARSVKSRGHPSIPDQEIRIGFISKG